MLYALPLGKNQPYIKPIYKCQEFRSKNINRMKGQEQMMRECRLMQNDTEEKEMHAYDDTKPVEANSCMSALVWLARRDLWSSITAHHIIMFNIIYYITYQYQVLDWKFPNICTK